MQRSLGVCLRALNINLKTSPWEPFFIIPEPLFHPSACSASNPCRETVSSCWFIAELWIRQRRWCCWSVISPDISQSLENCVPKALWNFYDKWQPALLRDFAEWRYIRVHTVKGYLGNCSVLSFSWHCTISLLYKCIEDACASWIPNTRFSFSFFFHDRYEDLG